MCHLGGGKMKNASVAAGIVRAFLDVAVAHGADRATLLSRSALNGEMMDDQDARIPLGTWQVLIHAAAELTGDPAIALHYATGTRIEQISIVGLITHSCASMADSMAQLNRYAKLMIEVDVMDRGERFTVDTTGGEVWIVDNRPDPNAFPEITEIAFGRFIGEFRRHFPDAEFAKEIQVTWPPPAHAAAYGEILRVPVTFNHHRNALRMAPEWLTVPFDETSSYVFGIFAERADALMAELERAQSMRGRIEAHILPLLHRGDIGMDAVASDLGMSRQTLYRRLRDEGITFATLLDDLRHRMAADYLRARKVSVNQTAYLVGFSESSSFVRAFRRWTGMTPLEFRNGAG